MLFLKSLTFILWNVMIGWSILYLVRWFLFNSKPRFFFRRRIPLTPGFIVRKREWVFNFVRDTLNNYIEQTHNENSKQGYIAAWEKKVKDLAWRKTIFVLQWRFLPHSFREKIRDFQAGLAQKLASTFLRSMVPRLIERFRIEYYIDKFDVQFGIDVIYDFFKRYIYRPVWYVFLALNLLIGIFNMIWFLIIG